MAFSAESFFGKGQVRSLSFEEEEAADAGEKVNGNENPARQTALAEPCAPSKPAPTKHGIVKIQIKSAKVCALTHSSNIVDGA